LSDLQNEGLIFRIPGKGTFVAKAKAFQQLMQLEGFAEAMLRMGYEIYNKVISHKSVAASPLVAHKLKLEPGTRVTEIKRVRHLNREPLSMEITYLPEEIGERLRNIDLPNRDFFWYWKMIMASPSGRRISRSTPCWPTTTWPTS
jgi:GntR family transcriptional regulator